MVFLRWQSPTATARGSHPGVFGLANGLARDNKLGLADRLWWRWANDVLDRSYPDPAQADPSLFDRARHPVTSCWFRDTAVDLLAWLPGYLDLLDRHGVAWQRLRSADPGVILYADAVQIVVRPYRHQEQNSVAPPAASAQNRSNG